ncbi:MAG: hypothetical protein LBM67_05555 [Lentimicrobiaceae bacterium]|jgi:hypothetical protein|nr:hypothetical protein [Lentimicrobiaceae bacterium]
MKKRLLQHFLILQLLLLTLVAESQQVEAISKIDRDSILVGQPICYELSMRVPNGFKIQWPLFEDTLSKYFEIIEAGEIKQMPYDADSNVLIQQVLNITSFETGNIEIPPTKLPFLPANADSLFFTVETQAHPVFVHTVAVDTTEVFKTIKAPLTVSNFEVFAEFILANYLYILLALLVIASLITGIHYYRKKQKTAGKQEPKKPKIPPHITALEALNELKERKLWQQGKTKEYYTELTEIVRLYIEAQFDIEAIEMTTDEILSEIETLNFGAEINNELANMLHTADLVKFAKLDPSPQENDISFESSVGFINKTTALKEQQETEAKKIKAAQEIQIEPTTEEQP